MKLFEVPKYIKRTAEQLTCLHRFDLNDLSERINGLVTWPCWKCHKVFIAADGLQILRKGKAQKKP